MSVAIAPFQVVEIEVNSRCNRHCSYCPQSLSWFRKPDQRMDESLFESIIEQLAELQFAGRLSFHMYNEPLLHPDLERLVAFARSRLALAWFVLYTNGDLLNQQRYDALLAAGIDHFLVTLHHDRPSHLPTRPFQEVRRRGEFTLSNRAGLVGQTVVSKLPCYGPSEMLMIHHNGAVVLCHEDAAEQQVMGWLSQQSILEIWQSEKLVKIRQHLEQGDRINACHLCNGCDNRLHPLPDTAI